MSGEYQQKLPSFLDQITDATVGISSVHHHLHEGHAYFADFADDSLADDETIILAWKTMAGTRRAHMVVEHSTLVAGDLEVWEGPSWTAETGTEAPIINRKREASMASSGFLANQAQAGFVAADVVVANPTGLNTGSATSLHHFFSWGTVARPSLGGSRDIREIIQKPDETYAVVFTAEGGSNAAQVLLNWYEHTDRG